MIMSSFENNLKPRKTDRFLAFLQKISVWVYENGFKALSIFAVLALVVGGVVFWRNFHARKAYRLSEKLFEATQSGGENREKILREMKKEFPFKPLGIWASLELSPKELNEKNCPQILEELQPYVGKGDQPILRSLVYQKVGACLEIENQLQKAEELYAQAGKDSKNILKDYAKLSLALVQKQQNKIEEAKTTLRGLTEGSKEVSEPVQQMAKVFLAEF